MKFDDIIIGGGLSGLICGLRLQSAGRNCAIVSAGQNAMHFSSGTFDLLHKDNDGNPVSEPLKAIESLGSDHPYKKIGAEKVEAYAGEIKNIFGYAGVLLKGDIAKNSYMMSPMGNVKPAWLALEDVEFLDSKDKMIGSRILIVNIKGYLDFNTVFIADCLERKGHSCRIEAVDLPEFERMRVNPSEMRSVNIAGVMEKQEVLGAFIENVNDLISNEDTVILPSVFGLKNSGSLHKITASIPVRTIFLGTMPPSIPGIRSQLQLKKKFEEIGGTMFLGDEVLKANVDECKVRSIMTSNLGEMPLEADNYVLATGSFFSKGLWATPYSITEPLFGLDTDFVEGRENWYDEDFFKTQAYLGFGVRTDNDFHPYINGKKICNLYAIGAVLGGYNPIKLGCGAGVAIMTALSAADNIIESNQ